MSNWADRAKTRFLEKGPGGTPKNPENQFMGFLGVGAGGFCENQGGFSGFMGVGIGANPEKRMFSDAPANDHQSPSKTGAELDPDRHCYPHSDAMNSSELALMSARLERFARIGMDVDQAEKLADRLKDRDREHDDRRACVECSSLTGGTGGWSCMAFRARGARDPGLPRDLVGMLARCPVFVAGEPSGGVFTTARPANEPRLAQRDRAPGPWLTPSEKVAADTYHQHHANCPQCQAAGRGYSSRCSVGAALWDQYQQEGTTQ